MKKAALGLLSLSVMISTAVFGGDLYRMDTAATLAISDKNDDRRIDREEYHERLTEVFFFIDADKDGSLTISEIRAVAEVDPERFQAADSNGDQTLSLNEYLYALHNDFAAYDRDKDGTLDMEELRLMVEK
jgi:Ca2+-binding EF-hand superfamily protein